MVFLCPILSVNGSDRCLALPEWKVIRVSAPPPPPIPPKDSKAVPPAKHEHEAREELAGKGSLGGLVGRG